MSGAILQLYQEQEHNPEVLTDLTYSNLHGYFTIEPASKGSYVLRVSALGYEPKDHPVIVTDEEKVVTCHIPITPHESEGASRIEGQITDQDQRIIPLAEVILYHVTEYGGMVPVGYQKTDQSGNYAFYHVPKGIYKVCLNVSQPVR